MAEPIRCHKHVIELKRAAESINKQLDDVVNGSLDFIPLGHQTSLSTLHPAFSSPEPQNITNRSNSATEQVDGHDEDEPTEHSK
jgi:hypothetical protein